jgi:integrase
VPTITKNSAGNWKALVRRRGWPTTVKTFRRKRDALDWARRVEDEMVRGVYVDRTAAERLTLRAAMARYLAEVSSTKSAGARQRERSTSRSLVDQLGDYSLAAITSQRVAEYRDRRLATVNRFGRNMSPNQVRLELALLSHLYTVAIQEWGVGLGQNPVMAVRKPRLPGGRNRRLTPDEERRLFAECRQHSNPMLLWIVKLAIETGMRRSEVAWLRRPQVDLERRVVRLLETKNGEVRTVPLSQEATRVIGEALAHPIRPRDTDLVFWGDARESKTGARKPYDFTEAWEGARRRAGLDDLRFHDLRHEAVSRLVEAGLSDQEVAAISGHKSMQMLRRYTHLRAEDLVARLDSLPR